MVRHADETMRYKVSDPQNQASEKILRAFGIEEFCGRYSVGRTTAYAEMKAGRLRRRKVGKRSIIAQEDAEAWLRWLPIVTPPTSKIKARSRRWRGGQAILCSLKSRNPYHETAIRHEINASLRYPFQYGRAAATRLSYATECTGRIWRTPAESQFSPLVLTSLPRRSHSAPLSARALDFR
jgi:hypothetical protein